jgi:hypothetical protein
MESQIALAMITRRYRVKVVPWCRPLPEPSMTLRPRGGVIVTLTPRLNGS